MSKADDFLAHYGKKGMKWGKITAEPTSGGSSSGGAATVPAKLKGKAPEKTDNMEAAIAAYYAKKNPQSLQAEGAAKKKAQSQQVANHVPGSKRTAGKDIPPDAADVKPKGMSRKQKIALGLGAAAAVGVLAYAGNKNLKEFNAAGGFDAGFSSFVGKRSKDSQLVANHRNQLDSIFGAGTGQKSQAVGEGYFYQGLMSGRALDRPGFTLPISTTLQRLSDHKETGDDYSKGMYSTFLHNDNKSYGGSNEFGNKGYTLNFKPDAPIKVPSTKQVLEAVREVNEAKGLNIDSKTTFAAYHAMSGGNWGKGSGKEVLDNLKKKGYSAIVDDMDAGYLGDLPIVFFGSTSKVTATPRDSKSAARDIAESVDLDRRYA